MKHAGRTWAAAIALLWLSVACGATRSYLPEPGPYDRLPEAWLAPLSAARLASDRGDAHGAYTGVAPLASEQPRILPVRTFLQELELELLTREGKLGSLVASSADEARAVLAAQYEKRAEDAPSAEGYVLAARLAASGEAGLALLDEADELDPRCVWVAYARAWWRYSLRHFREAREGVRAALQIDGGHLPTLRLHATMLAGAGDLDQAARALEVWLERSADSPLFSGAERADALLDLAALEVLLEQPKRALARLEELDPRAVRDPVRAEEVRAAAHEEREEISLALEAVRRARALEPRAVLPLVQEALLLQRAGDAEGERRTWQRLLDLGPEPDAPAPEDAAGIDFETALFRLQAHARLERLGPSPAPRP